MSWFKTLFSKKAPVNPVWGQIVIGKIVKAEKHPNADRLKVCTVDCGKGEIRNIVCGGSNVKDGMLVAVAKPGVKVHFGGGEEETELQETTIRGVVSQGMLCGADEIGLADRFPIKQEKEIIDLSELSGEIGNPLSSIL